MTTALLVLAGVLLFVIFIEIFVILFLLVQVIRDIRDMLTLVKINTTHISEVEKLQTAIHIMLVSEVAQSRSAASFSGPAGMNIREQGGKFVTEDGAHQADTFEELIQKISADPRYRVANDEDIDKLREQFENHSQEFDEDPEEDDDSEDWKDVEKNGT